MQVKKNFFTLSQTLQDKNIEENVTQPDKTSLKKNNLLKHTVIKQSFKQTTKYRSK